jgi:CubicO group peptidase (beta-lactamase class C family)
MFLNRREFCRRFLCGLTGPALTRAAASGKDGPEKLSRAALEAWGVPGVAVGVVRDDRLEYLAGHGLRGNEGKAPVSADTLFPIGSCSKAFTTAALAMLVDEGKLGWDDPVRKHVADFRVSDALADGRVCLRDLLCHRTGVATHDLLWYHANLAPEEAVRRLAFLPLDRPFRSAFQYQSTMFTAAGLAVASAAGKPWDAFVARRLFEPLGMKTAGCSTASFRSEDRAVGHRQTGDRQAEPLPAWHPFARPDAALSIHASARELCHWLRLHLNEGTFDGKRLVSAASLGETHTPQMVIPLVGRERRLHPDSTQMSYGLGWVIHDYRGWKIVAHAGVLDGFRVQLTMVPKARLGVVVLANMHGTRMNLALSYRLLEHYLKLESRDWNGYLLKQVREEDREQERARQEFLASRHQDTRPSRLLSAYAGTYSHFAYGPLRIVLERGRLVFRWGTFSAPLENFHYDTFTAQLEYIGEFTVNFALDAEGTVREISAAPPFGVPFRRQEQR